MYVYVYVYVYVWGFTDPMQNFVTRARARRAPARVATRRVLCFRGLHHRAVGWRCRPARGTHEVEREFHDFIFYCISH